MSGITLAKYRYVPPVAADFGTLIGTNSENPTLTDTADRGLSFAFGSNAASGDNLRQALKAKPTATDYDIIARLQGTPLGYNYYSYGLVVSDGTKFVNFGNTIGPLTGSVFSFNKYDSATAYNSNFATMVAPNTQGFEWFRIGVVGGVPTNFYISNNGKDWVLLLSSAVNSFLTYTHIGFYMQVNHTSGNYPADGVPQGFLDVLYWADADIVPAV